MNATPKLSDDAFRLISILTRCPSNDFELNHDMTALHNPMNHSASVEQMKEFGFVEVEKVVVENCDKVRYRIMITDEGYAHVKANPHNQENLGEMLDDALALPCR